MTTRAGAGSSRSRRAFLRRAGTFAAASALHRTALAALAPQQGHVTLPFENGDRELVAFPQKRPLIVLTSRPPQLETPFSVFDEGLLTPERRVLRPLPLERHPDGHRSRRLPASRRRRDRHAARPVAGRAPTARGSGGDRRRQPVLGQRPRPLPAARQRRPAVERRDGQRALDRRAAAGGAEKAGVKAGAVQVSFDGLDRPPVAGGAGLRQGARHRSRARRRRHARLADERRGPAAPQRLSAAPGRARLLRHLLGEARLRHPGPRQAVRRLLDEHRLSHPGQRLRLRRAGDRAGEDHAHRPLQRAVVHHQPGRRRAAHRRPRDRPCAASPSTAVTASPKWRSPPTAGRPGRPPASAPTPVATRSAAGRRRSRRGEAARYELRCAPSTASARPSRSARCGTPPATCATSSRRRSGRVMRALVWSLGCLWR